MKAVYLVGGPGSAWFPLANVYPKILFPVSNEPLLVHQLRALERFGVEELTVVLDESFAGHAQRIIDTATRAGSCVQVRVHLSSTPRGTAGAVKEIEASLKGDQPVLVMSAGTVLDGMDLRALAMYHAGRGGGLTMVLQADADGAREEVEMDAQGRVVKVNVPHAAESEQWRCCGLYLMDPDVLRHVPADLYVDLREQLVPELNEQGVGVHAYRCEGGVEQINTLNDYFRVSGRMLQQSGKKGRGAGWFALERHEDVWVGENTRVAPTAMILGPVLIGSNCNVEDGAIIIGPACIGDGCTVAAGAVVRESVLWREAHVAPAGKVEYSLVGETCAVPAGRRLNAAMVLPAGDVVHQAELGRSVLADRVFISEGGKVSSLRKQRLRHRAFLAIKRAFDMVGAAAGMFCLLPLLLVIAVAVKVDSPGPVFFSQTRIGQDGQPFQMLKFRTMVVNADQLQAQLRARSQVDGPVFKLDRDPRITRMGRLLRSTSLDEIPQLLNVLLGDMSLVGPRPLVMREMKFAPMWRDYRLSVKPGMTGLWQVSGRSSTGFDGWVRLDVEYVKQQSMMTDLRILMRTVGAVIGRVGAV